MQKEKGSSQDTFLENPQNLYFTLKKKKSIQKISVIATHLQLEVREKKSSRLMGLLIMQELIKVGNQREYSGVDSRDNQ